MIHLLTALLFFLALALIGAIMQRKRAAKERREYWQRYQQRGTPRPKTYIRRYPSKKAKKDNGQKRKRGRPRKYPVPEQRPEIISSQPAPAPAPAAPAAPVISIGRGWTAGRTTTALTPAEFLDNPALKYHVKEQAL